MRPKYQSLNNLKKEIGEKYSVTIATPSHTLDSPLPLDHLQWLIESHFQ